MQPRRAGRLVRGLVLVDEREGAAGRQWREQRRPRANGQPRVASRQRRPRMGARVVVDAGVQPRDGAVLLQPLRPAAGRLHVGDDDQRGCVAGAEPLHQAALASRANEQLGQRRLGAGARMGHGRRAEPATD